MHYTEIIAFLSLFVCMFLVIIGFFAAVKCIVVIYKRCTSRLWFKHKREGISNLILHPIEQTIYQVNLDDSSLVAGTQSIPLDRREFITKKVEHKVLEEALIQRNNVLKTINGISSGGGLGSGGTKSGSGSGASSHTNLKTLIDYDLQYLTNVAEMQRLVQSCWTTNLCHRETLSEEERWIQKLVLKVNLKIENAIAGYVPNQQVASAALNLNQTGQSFECPFSFLTGESTPSLLSPSTPLRRTHHHNNRLHAQRSRRQSNGARTSGMQLEGDLPPPKFETLYIDIDHPDWPPSYEKCVLGAEMEEQEGEGETGQAGVEVDLLGAVETDVECNLHPVTTEESGRTGDEKV